MTGFDSYLAAARGRPGGWRILVGMLIIAAFWFGGTALVLGVWTRLQMATGAGQGEALRRLTDLPQGGTPELIAVMLLTFSGVWLGVLVGQ